MTVSAEPRPNTEQIANWFRLFAEERWRLPPGGAEYADHDFLREHCRLGFSRFVSSAVDEALLMLLSRAARNGLPLVVGAPYTPCHWGALAVLFYLFRGNHTLTAPRRVVWLTTERRERALFAGLRMQSRFRRVSEAVSVLSFAEVHAASPLPTSLLILDDTAQLASVEHADAIVVSDGRGELVFRSGEASNLLEVVRERAPAAAIVLPSPSVTHAMAQEAMCWPWSDAAIANMRVPPRHRLRGILAEWSDAARCAGKTVRAVASVRGLGDIENLLAELKDASHKVFSRPKNFFDFRLTMEFQRIVGALRALSIPLDFHENTDDEQTLTARLARLDRDADSASGDIRDYLKIGLLLVQDLFKKLHATNAKWDLLRQCIDSAVAENADVLLAFPQVDAYSAERTRQFVANYVSALKSSIGVNVLAKPAQLIGRKGHAVLLGTPKLAHASRWRVPFDGRLTVLSWEFDRGWALLAVRGANNSAEALRRESWATHFSTPVDQYGFEARLAGILEETSELVASREMNASIEAFDPAYRGSQKASASEELENAVRARKQYILTFEDGSSIPVFAGEEHHVVVRTFGSIKLSRKITAELSVGDNLVLINGTTYDQLSARLQVEADRVSGLLSFRELQERWQLLCLEQADRAPDFIEKVRGTFGCERQPQTIRSWLMLERYGPEKMEDIVCVALAAEDYDLARSAADFCEGLNEKRLRHRRLGAYLTRALTKSTAFETSAAHRFVDENLGLTFADLQRSVSTQRIAAIRPPEGQGAPNE